MSVKHKKIDQKTEKGEWAQEKKKPKKKNARSLEAKRRPIKPDQG